MRNFKFLLMAFCLALLSANINAQECYSCAHTIPQDVNNQTYSNNVYCVHTDLRISGTVNFVNSEFIMDSGITVTVNPTAVLTIQSSHIYSCLKMWNGINVKPGGRVIVTGTLDDSTTSLIEDAIVAINFNMNDTAATFGTNRLTVDNAIFNRNHIAISISNYDEHHSSLIYTGKQYFIQYRGWQ